MTLASRWLGRAPPALSIGKDRARRARRNMMRIRSRPWPIRVLTALLAILHAGQMSALAQGTGAQIGPRLYVANSGRNSVSVIDPAKIPPLLATIAVSGDPTGTATSPDGSLLYVTSPGYNLVSVIDTAARKVTGLLPTGRLPKAVAVSPAGDRVYVANWGSDDVSVIDAEKNEQLGRVKVGRVPAGVA